MKTQQLPFDDWVEICSKLSVKDRTSCRLVSRLFKNSVDKSFGSVTHLKVRRKYDSDEEEEEEESSSMYHRFLHKSFIRVTIINDLGESFFSFFGKYCSNLQVLDARDHLVQMGSLFKIASKLQYFRCSDLEIADKKNPQSHFSHFEHLQAFDLIKNKHNNKTLNMSLNQHLLKKNRPILRLFAPSQVKKIYRETFNTMCQRGVICYDTISDNDLFLPSLAENLVELSVNFPPLEFRLHCERAFAISSLE